MYPIGMPGWVYVFTYNHNWIAGSVELAGILGMILGLVNAIRGVEKEPKWLNRVMITAMAFGLTVSLYDFGGIKTWNQALEITMDVSFFAGVYFLGKKKPSGYLWFISMLASNAGLQYIKGATLLAYQQILSMAFIIDAYRHSQRKVVKI